MQSGVGRDPVNLTSIVLSYGLTIQGLGLGSAL